MASVEGQLAGALRPLQSVPRTLFLVRNDRDFRGLTWISASGEGSAQLRTKGARLGPDVAVGY